MPEQFPCSALFKVARLHVRADYVCVCACAKPHGAWFVSFGGCELSWYLIAFASLIENEGLLLAQHE